MVRVIRDGGIALIAATVAGLKLGLWVGLAVGVALVVIALLIERRRGEGSSSSPTVHIHYGRQPTLAEAIVAAEPARKRAELSALITDGTQIRGLIRTRAVSNHGRIEESIRLKLPADDGSPSVESRLAEWLNESWVWVEKEAPEHLGYLTNVEEWPESAAIDSFPALIDARVAELRKVLDRL